MNLLEQAKGLSSIGTIAIERELCLRSFPYFCKWVFREIYKKEYDFAYHVAILCSIIEKVHAGEIQNVVINIPPRYYKTEHISILFPAWCYAKNTRCNFIITSYSDELALKNSNNVKRIISSVPYEQMFGKTLGKEESAKKLWSTIHGGGLRAASAGSSITGFGAGTSNEDQFGGCLIIDDPNKANDDKSEVMLEKVVNNYENTLSTRLNSKKTPVVVIMQRIHEKDLAGHLLSGRSVSGKFEHIRLEALKEKDASKYDSRTVGKALYPKKHNEAKLLEMQKANPYLYAGQFQQRPSPLEGNMVKRKDLRFYNSKPEEFEYVIHSVDMNFKKDGVSNACISTYGISPPKVYLLEQSLGKWSFPDAVESIRQHISSMQKYHAMIIEKKANGEALIAVLENEGFHSVIGIDCDKSKTYRLSEVSTFYAAGNVWYPSENLCPWITEHIHEVLTFPNAANDDRVDCETQMLKYYQEELSTVVFYDI